MPAEADIAFDSSIANGPILKHIQRLGRGYISYLKLNRIIRVSVRASAKTLLLLVRTKFTVGEHTQWEFTKTERVPNVNRPIRLLMLWSSAEATEASKVLLTNCIPSKPNRILNMYKRR